MADASGPADSNNLFQRWLTPRSNPALKSADSPSSTLVLGSDGWRPMAKPATDPVADAEFQAALKLFQQGKFEEAEKQFAKIAKDRKQSTWGENAAFYLAECQFQRKNYVKAHDSYEQLYARLPGDGLQGEAHPSASTRSARSGWRSPTPRSPPRRSCRGPRGSTAGCRSSTPRASGIKALEHVTAQRPDRPDRRQGRDRDRRLLHEARGLRDRRGLLRRVHQGVRRSQDARTSSTRSSPRSTRG